MKISPYLEIPISGWKDITKELVNKHPLSKKELLEIVLISWDRLWQTNVGGHVQIKDVELPSTVVGYFFQKLFTYELSSRYPNVWRGEKERSDKDVVNIQDDYFSTEMKSSGQIGYKLFGNRSYNQKTQSNVSSGKDKSGYYITINFIGQTITLLRIGWIDQDDWIAQGSETGQAATLKPDVYTHKLIEVNGSYREKSPVQLCDGVGKQAAEHCNNLGVFTFKDLRVYNGSDKKIQKHRDKNAKLIKQY
jgi:hypothetical protein